MTVRVLARSSSKLMKWMIHKPKYSTHLHSHRLSHAFITQFLAQSDWHTRMQSSTALDNFLLICFYRVSTKAHKENHKVSLLQFIFAAIWIQKTKTKTTLLLLSPPKHKQKNDQKFKPNFFHVVSFQIKTKFMFIPTKKNAN